MGFALSKWPHLHRAYVISGCIFFWLAVSIFPADYDHAEAEAKHLIHEADVDGDSKLSKEEFMEKYMLFVGSHIDVGEASTKHDEF